MKKDTPKLYIATAYYSPNTAVTNRLMGWLNNLSLLNQQVEMCFFMPTTSKAPYLANVNYHYYGNHFLSFDNKISYLVFLLISIRLFAFKVKKGDRVLLLGDCKNLIPILTKKKGVKVYHEICESPEVVKPRLMSLSSYLKSCSKLDVLFTISSTLKEYYRENGVEESRIVVLNMTVDAERFQNVNKQTVKNKYIAYCGTASNTKDGIDLLFKAFSIVLKEFPNIYLYIYGKTPKYDEHNSNMELIEQLKIRDRVVFKGIVDRDLIPQSLKNAELLVLCRPKNKQAKYGFPTKLGEYLLTGNPVLVTDVGTITDFLKDGYNAFISKPDDPLLFAEKICWILNNYESPLENY